MAKPMKRSHRTARPDAGCAITLLFAAAALTGLGKLFTDVLL